MKSLVKRFNELIGFGLFFILTFCLVGQAMGQTLGMVADNSTNTVTVFDADADVVLGSIPVPIGSVIGDCSITPDQAFGFVTNFNFVITPIDLQTLIPLAGIPISNQGEDTSITADGNCMVICDGALNQPVSSIDINLMMEVDTLALGVNCNSMDVCSDGTVLITSVGTDVVRRLTIDSSCMLTDTGDTIGSGLDPNNVTCALDSASLVTMLGNPARINSFTTPPLAGVVDTQGLPGFGISSVINQAGNVVYAMTTTVVDAFSYNSFGNIGPSIGGSFPIATAWGGLIPFGIETIALHPNGTKLYVSQPGSVDVFDANTGVLLTSITDPNIVEPLGVCLGFNQPPPPPATIPTLSEWGLIAMAGILGIVGFMVMRRRKVTA